MTKTIIIPSELAHSCRELFPIMDIAESLSEEVGLPMGETKMKISIDEDNYGILILEEKLPS